MKKITGHLHGAMGFVLGTSLLIALCPLYTGCNIPDDRFDVIGSPVIKEYNLDFTGFEQVVVTGPIPTEIFQTSQSYVTVKVNEDIFQHLQVEQYVDVLRIELDPLSYQNLDIRLSIGMPELRALSISSAGRCILNGFNSSEIMEISVSAASELELKNLKAPCVSLFVTSASVVTGNMTAEEERITVSGASRLELNGQCSDAFFNVMGASSLNMANYWVNNAEVIVSGVSSASINAGGKLSIDLSGVSNLTYGGNPSLGTVKVGAGSTLKRR